MTTLRLTIALALAGCSTLGSTPTAFAPVAPTGVRAASNDSKDLYLGNILGGVLLYSTGKKLQEVGDISADLPRVTGVWVDQRGTLYAFSDNRSYPYETIEEFKKGAQSPFFSLTLKRYGSFVAADAHQNVYTNGENSSGKQVIDVYPPGSQKYANEYVVPSVGSESGPQGMAFDSTGAFLVGVAALAGNHQGQIGQVFRLNGSSGTFVSLKLKKAYGGLIALDGAGNLYVGGATRISVYAPGATNPSRVIKTKTSIVSLIVAADGTLYVSYVDGTAITIYAPGQSQPNRSFDPEAQVSGLALGPG